MQRKSFVDQFIYHAGDNEVPREFYRWSAISLIAACVGDRVWMEKFRGSRLIPNLYVLLVGPSGSGKGVAIDAALKFIRNDDETNEGLNAMNIFRGKATAPHLVDFLSKRAPKSFNPETNKDEPDLTLPTYLYLITPELAFSTGDGPIADMFVKMMTELYTGGDYTLQEGTRTSGHHKIHAPVINWFGGSTEEWMVQSLSRAAIEGGFFARIVTVDGHYNTKKRVYEPQYPDDYDEVCAFLQKRVNWMLKVQGKVKWTKEAKRLAEQWYNDRQAPEDDAMLPTWKREDDMMRKFAMITMLDRRPDRLVISSKHVIEATRMLRKVQKIIPKLITISSSTPENEAIMFVRRVIQNAGSIRQHVLIAQGARRGLTSEKTLQASKTLIDGHEVEKEGAHTYVYKKRKRL